MSIHTSHRHITAYPCKRDRTNGLVAHSRRSLLQHAGMGFGALAAAALFAGEHKTMDAADRSRSTEDLGGGLHHRATAKRVIFLYMDGGVSQVDSFDPKTKLNAASGKPFPMKTEQTQFDNKGNALGTLWKFQNRGESGLPISDLFPNIATCADSMCVVRSMTSQFSEHTSANYFLHSGLGIIGRPSMGAWATYGLGSQSKDLPGFVVLNGGLTPPGGLDNFSNGFLPATYQASVFGHGKEAIANLRAPGKLPDNILGKRRDLLRGLDQLQSDRMGNPDSVESAIRNYELAYRMQMAVPELTDLSQETQATRDAYGVDAEYRPTAIYARQCLIARRLAERGVRFIELTCPNVAGDRWDQHNNLKKGHENNARAVDQPIAALINDLAQRGMLDETLIVFTGEFGRTPFAQGSNGRDHNPYGFSLWMAGGGIRGGISYGATDEMGYKAVENPLMIHDLHAMMLHAMGIDHRRLTFRFGGRDMRLTDVHGTIIPELFS